MSRLTAFALAALLLLSAGACSRKQEPGAFKVESSVVHGQQASSALSSVVHVADPKTTGQLLTGWHPVEQGSWRWTEKQFTVDLKIPSGAKANRLQLKFTLPEPLLSRGPITLAATINGVTLPAETYSRTGDHVYSRVLPASVTGEVARVAFRLDKALPPNDVDRRELGFVVSSVGIE